MDNLKPIEDVPIFDRSGTKLCSIHCPQSFSHFVPLPLPPFAFYGTKKWTNPHAILSWAWHQAFETNESYKELGFTSYLAVPPIKCVICNTLSVKPINRKTLFGTRMMGVQCNNEKCAMFQVTIPWQMLKNLKEVPSEYIPKGFYVNRGKEKVSDQSKKETQPINRFTMQLGKAGDSNWATLPISIDEYPNNKFVIYAASDVLASSELKAALEGTVVGIKQSKPGADVRWTPLLGQQGG